MERKFNGLNAAVFRFLICMAFIILVSGTAFGHGPSLVLTPSTDVRIETVYSCNTLIGYNLYVRQKPGMESVMLTEPTGNYALRSVAWNSTNGNEVRKLSGVILKDANSRYSILSSTPICDGKFGSAFHLFIPVNIVYGNPSSACGPVYLNSSRGLQVNIRTFDHKYADPNYGKFQNNMVAIGCPVENTPRHEIASPIPSYNRNHGGR